MKFTLSLKKLIIIRPKKQHSTPSPHPAKIVFTSSLSTTNQKLPFLCPSTSHETLMAYVSQLRSYRLYYTTADDDYDSSFNSVSADIPEFYLQHYFFSISITHYSNRPQILQLGLNRSNRDGVAFNPFSPCWINFPR